MELTTASIAIVKSVLKPQGFNLSMNLGAIAGAGIPSPIHIHVLPRWPGDTNFLPALTQTKVISFDLKQLYEDLKSEFMLLKL